VPIPVEDVPDDAILIRRFPDRREYYTFGRPSGVVFMRRPDEIDPMCSVYARSIMRHDLEWCAKNIREPMLPFGVEARVPREGCDGDCADVVHAPTKRSPSHTHVIGLTQALCDHLAENGEVIDDLPECLPRDRAA